MSNRTAAHQALVAEILAACGSRPDCRMWANNTGVARALTHAAVIHFGLKGSADILGLTSDGRFLAIEAKTGEAKQRKEQKAFGIMVMRFRGRYLVARAASDVTTYLDALKLPATISC